MKSINSQLNIAMKSRPVNSNIRTRYARGMNDYQVQLGTEDPALDYYNDIRAIKGYHNANAGERYKAVDHELKLARNKNEEFSNFVYPACVKLTCKTCKNECKTEQGLKWRKGGKECYKSCIVREKTAIDDRIRGAQKEPTQTDELIQRQQDQAAPARPNTGTMIAVGVGALLLIGGIVYLIRKKK